MEITPKQICVRDLDGRNDNNHYHLSPFKFDFVSDEKKITKLIIDKTWYYQKISGSAVDDILRESFPIELADNILFGEDEYPEFVWDTYFKVYTIVYTWYSAEHWYKHLNYPVERIVIDPIYFELLEEIARLQYHGRSGFKKILNNPKLQPLKDIITPAIKKLTGDDPNVGVFVKTDEHSTKHDYPVIECFNADDVLSHIFGGITAIRALVNQKSLSLYLKKWNPNISGQNEFRGFVEDGQIIGISQQCLYEIQISMKYHICNCQSIYTAIQAEWNRIYKELDEKHKYKDAVIDFYVEDETKVVIIEINTIGGWGPAGSSLFKWISDPPNKSAPEFRITSDTASN